MSQASSAALGPMILNDQTVLLLDCLSTPSTQGFTAEPAKCSASAGLSNSAQCPCLDLLLASKLARRWPEHVECDPGQGGYKEQGDGAEPASHGAGNGCAFACQAICIPDGCRTVGNAGAAE